MQTINMKLTFGSINTISQIIAFICQLELWANFGPNILFGAFRIGGAEKCTS